MKSLVFYLEVPEIRTNLVQFIRIQPCARKTGMVKHNEKGDHY